MVSDTIHVMDLLKHTRQILRLSSYVNRLIFSELQTPGYLNSGGKEDIDQWFCTKVSIKYKPYKWFSSSSRQVRIRQIWVSLVERGFEVQ